MFSVFFSSHVDVGGQWVSSGQKEIMEVLDELSLQTIPQSSSGRKIIEIGAKRRSYKHDMHMMGRNWLALLELQFLINKIDKLSEQVDMRCPYSSPRAREFDSETLHTFLKRNTRFQVLIVLTTRYHFVSTRPFFNSLFFYL